MVPQVIPLRRCRYCMVLVGNSETSWEGSGARLRFSDLTLASPPQRGLPDSAPNLLPSSLPSLLGPKGASIEPDCVPTAAPAGPTLQ